MVFHYNEDQSGDNVELLRQLALRLASLGCLVVAVDIDGETNKATVEDIQVVVRSRRSSSDNIYFTASRKDGKLLIHLYSSEGWRHSLGVPV